MRTTLDLDDDLVRAVKKRIAEEGTTFTRFVEDALRRHLRPERASKAFRLRLLTKRGRRVRGVDVADRDALYERMEGRD